MLNKISSIIATAVVLLNSIVNNSANSENNQYCDARGCDFGKAIQIISFIDGEPIYEDQSTLEVFMKAEGKPAIIISMTGVQGIGKSFLLNLCLRYLNYHKYNVDKSSLITFEELLGNNRKLSGFEWGNKVDGGGTTMGINIWSEPFFLKLKDNTEVAVFLMDTQGSHDGNSDSINNAIVCSLSALISSIQVYNINKKPQSYDYEHFVGFSNNAATTVQQDQNLEKIFQKLIFLIRDWPSSTIYTYGMSGGERYRNDVLLAIKDETSDKIRNHKIRINESYDSINCLLIPNPGSVISGAQNSVNLLDKSISNEFSHEIINFMNWIFGEENINSANIKKIYGLKQPIYSDSIPKYFYTYFNELKNRKGKYSSIDDFNNANIRANNDDAVRIGYARYLKEMKLRPNFDVTWDEQKITNSHNEALKIAIDVFRENVKLGDKETHFHYERYLERFIYYSLDYAKNNVDKNGKSFYSKLLTVGAAVDTILAGGYASHQCFVLDDCQEILKLMPYSKPTPQVNEFFMGLVKNFLQAYENKKA